MAKLPSKPVRIAIVSIVALVVVIGFVLAIVLAPIMPPSIKKQLSFIVLYPSGNGFTIDRSSWKYDSSLGLLTYIVTYSSNDTKITVSEQSSPPEFSEVPGTLDTLTTKLNTYSDFDTLDGHVYLTHPTELKGNQSALMNTEGTLMFAKPDKNLGDDDWRRFFNSLDTIK